MMILMLALLLDEKPQMSTQWRYRLGTTEATVTLGEPKEIDVFLRGRSTGRELKGMPRETYVIETDCGYLFVSSSAILADLRWGGDDRWSFRRAGGKREPFDVDCRRVGEEKLGPYVCRKFTIDGKGWWFARGIGILKAEFEDETWELASPKFPVGRGAKWTYRGGASWTIGERKPHGIEISGSPWFLVEFEGGFRFVEERRIGIAAVPAFVTVAEFRWSGDSWTFETAGGCLRSSVEVRRVGSEKLAVPAGTFECAKFRIGKELWWFAPGVGLVRRQACELQWELVSFEPK